MHADAMSLEMADTREARFRALVAENRESAVGLAWRLLGGDRATAEDVTQQAFLRAWRALPGFRDDARLSTWFHRILIRQVRSHQRWAGVRRRFGGLWGETPEVPVLPTPQDDGLRRRIGAALERLSPGQREAFVLVHLQGLTIEEAAAALDRAPGTIKSHLHRALGAMRADLADLRREEAA
ncbi:MAG: RNA polymerase sigma factor [Myxococcales bacterium]|nr:RNA polymerase sigma factor [Myxococcales bacterium]